jgi:hypothetical protein
LGYQWFFGADPIANATNASLVLTDLHASQSGAYSVKITSANLSTNSMPAMLSVVPLIDIKSVPALYLSGDVGRNYRPEFVPAVGPTNAWITLTNLTLVSDPHIFFDLSAIGQPTRFYRLLQLPY